MDTWTPEYEKWRHGGWYVMNVRYPSGAVGCVSRNYPDGKWRIVCDERLFKDQPTFRSRDEAARAERDLVKALARAADDRHRWLTLAIEAATGASRDYGGGYRDGAECEAFLHGMQTIVNVLVGLRDRDDFQSRTCVAIGRAAMSGDREAMVDAQVAKR